MSFDMLNPSLNPTLFKLIPYLFLCLNSFFSCFKRFFFSSYSFKISPN